VMTPQLQQAIKLLQLTRLELQDVVRQELEENPLLEETAEVEDVREPEPLEASEKEVEPEVLREEFHEVETGGKPCGTGTAILTAITTVPASSTAAMTTFPPLRTC
jgi:DNA-directed RNA polymerase specialized sigma54-like protein